MTQGFSKVPPPINEPVRSYKKGSEERKNIEQCIRYDRSVEIDVPMIIGGKEIWSDEKVTIHPPHDIKHVLGHYYKGNKGHVQQAIDQALKAKRDWENLSWENRASVFLRAAELLAGPYRDKINSATMLCQSKNIFQAEIDSACELIDFFRYNVYFMTEIFNNQPVSPAGIWNRLEQRPLEGFVFALTPFNFTSIAGNLPTAPAIMGNVVVWKPSKTQIYSARVIMEVLMEAGLPDGVINIVYSDGPSTADAVINHREFTGLHYTGSTEVFGYFWKSIGDNIKKYKTYPRIVGETGGKDFVLIHPSAHVEECATALTRGAFEYQGQKCSAASRAYVPKSLWKNIKEIMAAQVSSFRIGGVEDLSNFYNAVIDEKSFDKIVSYIEKANKDTDAEIIIGGGYDKSKGYFIDPTVIETTDPHYVTMEEELFGPVLTVYVYDDKDFSNIVDLVDRTSNYGLTGAIFAKDRKAIEFAMEKLKYAAGNFYINDKPTGAVVGQQPFGGARGSGTNDKAGSLLNMLRWVSPRSIKENFNPPKDYRYPFMG